ncbi:MAG: DUF2797 domain-containing protein [Halobacteriaceae archaeon]
MQVVGYDGSPDPALHLAEDGDVRTLNLDPGTELEYALDRRHCAGTVRNQTHEACDSPVAPYCPEHESRWPCARCAGNCSLPIDACHEEHAIYLAAFAPSIWKVGVTRSWRLSKRLQEQGADLAAHVETVETGRRARQIEADIATEITDRVRVPRKISGLHRTVDRDAWQGLMEDFDPIQTYAFDYGLDLETRPISDTVATGTVRGVQGRVLLLDRGQSTYAVDLRDLVGHDVNEDAPTPDRQSDLNSFD